MAAKSGIFEDVVPILALATAPYRIAKVKSIDRTDDVSEFMTIGVARGSRAVSHGSFQWWSWAKDRRAAEPDFEWRAIAEFRPTDPILVLHTADFVHGMMQIREKAVVPCAIGGRRGPLVYVSFIEVAPWNRSSCPVRIFKGLGVLLLRFACERSKQLGYDGRVGLHALPQAQDFYLGLGFKPLIICPNEYKEVYFELDELAGTKLMADRREAT